MMTQDHYMYYSQDSHYHPTLFGDCCDVTGCYGELKFLNGCHLHPLYHRTQDENAPNEEGVEECYLPYADQSNRLVDHDLFCGDYWREACNCFANSSHQGASASSLEETEDQGQSTEDCACYVSYQEESESQPTCDYDSWSSYKTWIGYGEQEDSFDKGSQGHSYSSELGFCEGIFGYWPCLYQKTPH